MKHRAFAIAATAFFLVTVWAHFALGRLTGPQPVSAIPERIVSLAPSVTETLYAVGLGSKVVGVTDFCAYPPDVLTKPRVAGFSSVNYEAVLRARPDLVALPVDKTGSKLRLERLGLPVLTLDTRTLSGLMETIASLGNATGHAREADALLAALRDGIAKARRRAYGKTRPKVLFSVMHSYEGSGYISEINVIGKDGFYSELIETAGGVNAYQGSLPFPLLSREAIIFLNPDVIIDVIPAVEDVEAVRRDWQSLGSVNAIKNKRLHLFTDRADTVPGPRFYQTLARLSQAFHPDTPERER